ncbi:subunit epsilon of coatomer protein complex [Chloropicon primus]|uniref:Coatomer subunit epsilon n=1 Tax=Chloropicon primus TaxID=1764295 RepID=A0A5B8MTS3_9CHLO|nr:subunit epsilon of coatomer protein complex [Chloropicon primus]UPR03114.1 subunit epsilon of coatomer protein complex [Chloropicon primus]|eukprot:QDZ23903.1 subunit epsilon of coatomer protein complex [Chloropicon primus]
MAEGGRDLLYALRNNFHLGAYQAAIGEAQDLEHDDLGGAETVSREVFKYRAYIEMGQPNVCIEEVTDDSEVALQACKLLATVRLDPSKKDEVVEQVEEWLSDEAYASNLLLSELCGEIYMATEKYEEAMKCCSSAGSLELLALAIQVALQIERPDVAKKLLDVMQQKDDDAPLTQLANAWVDIQLGGDHVQEAQYIFQELGDRFNWTPKLLNGSAICNMVMGKFDSAEKQILEALSKDPRNADTLANAVTASLHLQKPAAKYLAQLKTASPNHPLVRKMDSLEEKFAQAAAAF